jgi:predicted ATPase
MSSFIGRETQVARVISALGNSRVVTITGVGGVGKTRLSLQVAAELLPRYREGAWLVELAPVREPSAVVEAVAAVFRVQGSAGKSLEESLIESLAPKQLLLVLDNCEHVLGSVARLVTKLEQSCSDVSVLATSREGMGIEGEQLLALPPLEAGSAGDDPASLVYTDAVRLFVERARNVKADFALTPINEPAVVEVCQRLDGVPLAIELAAARVIALSPAELLRRLDRRFHVLAGGRRGAVERHATLRAAIDWSYELLSAAEQQLLNRLTVFSGGATLEAIEDVCSGDEVERDLIFDLLANLVARSLVIAEDHPIGTRYRLLETIRQYGEEKLAERDETDAVRLRHATYYADFERRVTEMMQGPDEILWLRQVLAERDNISSAIANAIDLEDASLAVRLVAEHPQLDGTVIAEVNLVPASRVVDLPGASEQPGYARVVMWAAFNAAHSGDHHLVEPLIERAQQANRTEQDPQIESLTCSLRAQAALGAGCYEEATSYYEQAAELARLVGRLGQSATYLAYAVNTILLGGGDISSARGIADRSVQMARESEMPKAISMSLNALALTVIDEDPDRARSLLYQSVRNMAQPGQEISSALITAALVAGRLGDWPLTLALAGRCIRNYRWDIAHLQAATHLAQCSRALAETEPETAAVLYGSAYAAFARANPDHASRRPEAIGTNKRNNFVLGALTEAGAITAATLASDHRRELRAKGAAMTTDEAIAYALNHIDPRFLTGPIDLGPIVEGGHT